MRFSAFLSSLGAVAVLGACSSAFPTQQATRAAADPLSFHQSADAVLIEEQSKALNSMADQLVRRSTIGSASTGALITCGIAVATSGGVESCVTGAAVGGAAGAVVGAAQGNREVADRVELVSADALVRSIRGMNGQMDALELSLPDLLAEQDAEFRDLEMRRDAGAVTPQEYNERVNAILGSRARLTEALTLTIAQVEQAQSNIEGAASQGQSGLDWHLSATAQLAREANSARSMISPLGRLTAAAPLQTALDPVASVEPIEADAPVVAAVAPPAEVTVLPPVQDTQLASNVQAPRTDIVTIKTTTRTRTRKPLINVVPRSGVLR